jgi:hypothetical protein
MLSILQPAILIKASDLERQLSLVPPQPVRAKVFSFFQKDDKIHEKLDAT